MRRDRGDQQTRRQVEVFGPRRSRDRVGVPSDHFDRAEVKVLPRHRRGLKALRRERARREATRNG